MPEPLPDELVKRVLDEVDVLAERIVASTAEIIRIPSVNPKYPGQDYDKVVGHEGEASALMAELYRLAGAEVEMVTVERGRDNACARIPGAGGGASLLFNGHVDVVPAEKLEAWARPPFAGLVEDDKVWGRGATDMKGGMISHAYAAIALARLGIRLKGDLVFSSVVGEEVGDHLCGTTAALEAGYLADAAIVCEPSSFNEGAIPIVPVTPGLVSFTVTIEGKTAHSGLRGMTLHPTLDGELLGVNAIDKFVIIYQALRNLEDEWAQTNRHPLFPPGYFGMLPGVIQGNPTGILAPLFLSDTVTVQYSSYHHPDRSNEEVMEEIRQTVARAAASDHWLRHHPPVVEFDMVWPSHRLSDDSALLATVASAHERAYEHGGIAAPAQTGGFFGVCDQTWIDAKGITEGLVYGPGVGKTAHAEDEFVPIEQLVAATKTYALTVLAHCGVADRG